MEAKVIYTVICIVVWVGLKLLSVDVCLIHKAVEYLFPSKGDETQTYVCFSRSMR